MHAGMTITRVQRSAVVLLVAVAAMMLLLLLRDGQRWMLRYQSVIKLHPLAIMLHGRHNNNIKPEGTRQYVKEDNTAVTNTRRVNKIGIEVHPKPSLIISKMTSLATYDR